MPVATLTCPECGIVFQYEKRYRSKQTYCSPKCTRRVWRRARHQSEPAKVCGEWREAYRRTRDHRLVQQRKYNVENNEVQTTKKREHYAEHREENNQRDRDRWIGVRRDTLNEQRKMNFQQTRLTTPWKSLLASASERAERKSVPYLLTPEWAATRWTGKCEITGIEFRLGQRGSGPKMFSPSIDRIVPELGYVPSNCRFVLWAVNAFKHDGNDEDMYRIALAIVEKYLAKTKT